MSLPSFITEANARASKASARSPYPHMSPADTKVWVAFLQTGFVEFTSASYDVAVGGKAAHQVADDAEFRPMWETLLKKRIDAVLFRTASIYTCEVKPTANMSALGQALSYAMLYQAERSPTVPVFPAVVCARVDADLEPVYLRYGVLVVVVDDSPESSGTILKVLGEVASPGQAPPARRPAAR